MAPRADSGSHSTSSRSRWLVRDAQAGAWFEAFFVSAVATILVVRAFLALTGYPQLGGRRLHIAHALWGGFGMAAALMIALVSLRARAKLAAALIGGAGFGLFIDEIGKFLTRDTNYFFRPAIAVIYLVFVVMFLIVRTRLSSRALGPDERLANAAALLTELAVGDLDPFERQRALDLLSGLDPADPRVAALSGTLSRFDTVPAPPVGRLVRLTRWVRRRAYTMLAQPIARQILSWIVVGQALATIVWAALKVHAWWSARAPTGVHVAPVDVDWIRLGTSLVSGGFVWVGVFQQLRGQPAALRNYRRALLISLLLTQIFVFYDSQLAGLATLALNLALLAALELVMREDPPSAVS